jgi:hypothetical protein
MALFSEITFTNIKFEVERYLKETFNKANILFSPSSPYGQILSVLENMHQLSFLYLKNSISQFDLGQTNTFNERVIRNAAISAGHIPGRGISATGTLKFTLKSSSDIDRDIPGGRITLRNKLLIKNKTNSLDYSFNIGNESITHRITPNYQFFVPIIQGSWKTKTYTGDGTRLQTISVNEIGRKDVENFNIEVTVNGDYYVLKNHLFEMLTDEKACIVRTGFNGGIDIIFGTGDGFGVSPTIGSVIEVKYIVTDGSLGNIFRRTINDFKFIDDIISADGEVINVDKVFDIQIYTDINFGADKESILFTKNVLPIVSNNFVLGLPQQYAYQIKKLGVFSHVNAYELSGTVFIVATPNINLFKSQNADYFSINIKAFELDNYEKSKIDKYLRIGGNIQLTKKYKIVSPVLSYYTMNIFFISYNDATDESVSSQVLDKISEYFLNLSRIDRIPKLDIIRELSSISDIHSVDVQFISKKNEDYHNENMTLAQNKLAKYGSSSFNVDISTGALVPGYDPSSVKGLDPVLGDIIFESNEIPIIRGGWTDRNGVYYSDGIDSTGLKTVNFIKKGTVDSKNRPNI